MTDCKGYIDSIYSGSCVDGSGIRAVVFLCGCNLRCPFCHNPETLYSKGEETAATALVKKLLRYRDYLSGGVTLSGGEPFLQPDFSLCIMEGLRKEGISTVIETNGSVIDDRLISAAEYLIVDVKNQNQTAEKACGEFLRRAAALGKKVELTCVLIKGVNDGEEKLRELKSLSAYPFVLGTRLLPFRKLCMNKYEEMKLSFPFADKDEFSEKEFSSLSRVFCGLN